MYCPMCGAEHADNAIACPGCGRAVSAAPASRPVSEPVAAKYNTGLRTAAKIVMLVEALWFVPFLFIPYFWFGIITLAWTLPMTITYWRKVNNHEPVSTGFKVCTLLFVSKIAGILMLCDHEG